MHLWLRRVLMTTAALLLGTALAATSSTTAIAAETYPTVALDTCVDQTLEIGSRGPCVLAAQKALGVVGIVIKEDGDFGSQTQTAFRGFQSNPVYGLSPSGIATPQTLKALNAAAYPPAAEPANGSDSTKPQGKKFGDGIIDCRDWACSYYYSRSLTKTLDDKLNSAEGQLITGVAGTVACAGVHAASGMGVACEALFIAGSYEVSRALTKAAADNACLQLKVGKDGSWASWKVKVTTHNGRNCID